LLLLWVAARDFRTECFQWLKTATCASPSTGPEPFHFIPYRALGSKLSARQSGSSVFS
jgi:hypothetical protein